MHGRPAMALCLLFQLAAQGGFGFGQFAQSFEQGLEVQHGAAGQQRQVAALLDPGDQLLCIACKLCGTVALAGIDDVDQVVWNRRQLFGGGFGRSNVHAPVDQSGIDADDFHRQVPVGMGMPGDGECRGGLATRGRTGQCQIA